MLSMIAIAIMVLLVIAQQSRTAATENEARANASRRLAEERLDQLEKADRARHAALVAQEVAEHDANVVIEEKALVSGELARSKEDLIKERDHATANALAAKRAQRSAEENERKATRSRNEAVAAQEGTTQVHRELQKALDKEHKRVLELENSIGSKPIPCLRPWQHQECR